MKLLRKIRSKRAAPGIERQVWRLLPAALLASILGPLAIAVGGRLLFSDGSPADSAKTITTLDIFSVAAATTLITAVFTVGVGCVIVMIMKGPAYIADGYELQDAERPAGDKELAAKDVTREGENRGDDQTL